MHYLLEQADTGNQPRLIGGLPMARNPKVTVRELLDRAAREIEGKFANQELTEAAIRLTIGDAYLALGQYAEAEKHLERSVQLRTAKRGADHPDTFRSKTSLAELYHAQGQYDRAEPLLRDLLDRQRRLHGDDSPEVAGVLAATGRNLNGIRKYADAEPVLRRCLELSPNHPDAHSNVGLLLKEQGRIDEALLYYDKAIARNADFDILQIVMPGPAYGNRPGIAFRCSGQQLWPGQLIDLSRVARQVAA